MSEQWAAVAQGQDELPPTGTGGADSANPPGTPRVISAGAEWCSDEMQRARVREGNTEGSGVDRETGLHSTANAGRHESLSVAEGDREGVVRGVHPQVAAGNRHDTSQPAVDRRLAPLFTPSESPPPNSAKSLTVTRCEVQFARRMNAAWHSRLPDTQKGPWKYAFAAEWNGTCFGVALWHNPSARTLPQDWLELRRLAIAPDAPKFTATRMLGQMARYFKRYTEAPRLISYQDVDVHQGTIYRAANWTASYYSKPRQRDRSKPRKGTRRDYRSNQNGVAPDAAGKVRWELVL